MRITKKGEKRFTISDIKFYTENNAPHFFDRKSLKFFGQTMGSFKVIHKDERVFIVAPINGSMANPTLREFVYNEENPCESTLERVTEPVFE